MLRLLGRTVSHLWEKGNQPADATAIHVHHIDPGFGPIHQEFVTRLNLQIYNPAIRNDIVGEGTRTALARRLMQASIAACRPTPRTWRERSSFIPSGSQLKSRG
jgi:hypothetical protein